MKVFLYRHAQAEDREPDEARQLTRKGQAQIKAVAQYLPEAELDEVVAIWHSTLVRAKETASLFGKHCSALKKVKLEEIEGIGPYDDVEATANLLGECEGDVILVSHNPFLERLVTRLTAGEEGDGLVDFKKGGMLALERVVDPTGPMSAGLWSISWFVIPRLAKA